MHSKKLSPRNRAVRAAFAAAGLLCVAPAAFPECSAQGCYDVYIDELYAEAAGGVWIKTSGDETLAGCVADSNVFLRLPASVAGFKEIYATLLAAQLADKRVSIRVNPASNPCTVAYVTLNRNYW
jgi:hypothetical protein